MANKPIPIGIAKSKKTKPHNYTGPTKPGEPEPGVLKVEPKIPRAPKLSNGHNVLGREGMREWRRVVGLLANAKVIAEIDRAVLTQYCKLWEMFVADAAPTVDQSDLFGGGSGGKGGGSTTEFTAALHTQMRLCAVELGLTPSARSRLRG